MSFSLRHVETFHAIMTCGSVTEAATLLHTSQPTISRELARFEYLTGLKLFERVRGRLRPTVAALQLFEEVQRSYQGLERIASAAQAIRHVDHGQLSIACLPMFSQTILPETCKRFLQRYPNASLNITPQESPLLEEWLSAQRHDIGLTESQFTPPGTRRQRLFCSDELAVLPPGHRLADKDELSWRDFAGEAFVSLSSTDIYRQKLDSLFEQHGVERRLVLETHSAASVCSMVSLGIGVAIVNPLTAQSFAHQGVVLRRLTESIPFSVQLIQPIHRPASVLAEYFVKELTEVLAEARQQLDEHGLAALRVR